jgi:hypothetical protein
MDSTRAHDVGDLRVLWRRLSAVVLAQAIQDARGAYLQGAVREQASNFLRGDLHWWAALAVPPSILRSHVESAIGAHDRKTSPRPKEATAKR